MKSRKLAIVSALLASSCCIIPLTLALVGLGTLGFGSVLGKYHWPIQIAGAALLGVAWVVFLREKRRLYALAADIKHERLTRSLLSVASVLPTVLPVCACPSRLQPVCQGFTSEEV